ncbi:MAG: glycosyltransferase family 4 protein [Terriglobales bacterium]
MASPSPDIDEQHTSAEARKNIRVAWLFPSLARGYYWQPVFKNFAACCPQTAIFTAIWPGFLPGYEGAFEVHILPGLRYIDLKKQLPDSRRGFIWTPPSILGQLAAFGPHVIFSAGFSGWTLCALLFSLLRRSRVIIYWEGCSAQSIGSTRIKRALRRCIARFADAAVSNSEEGTGYLRDVLKMPPHKLLCHPFQVPELSLLNGAAENHFAGKRPVFLYVGSISPRKGWNYLLEATRILVNRGIREFSVLFAGAGEQEDELRAAIKAFDLGDIVQHVGAVPYQKLGSYYRSADVFVSPTRADTWGVAVLEAMAFGKPVLCSKYAGTRQMITPGENGFIFDPFEPAQLADYMTRFIGNRTLAVQFGVRSLEKIAPYTPERAAGVLADLAFETIERKRRRTPLKFRRDSELVTGA